MVNLYYASQAVRGLLGLLTDVTHIHVDVKARYMTRKWTRIVGWLYDRKTNRKDALTTRLQSERDNCMTYYRHELR